MDGDAHPLLVLARQAIAAHVGGAVPPETNGTGEPARGCFVSLKQGEDLRGCVGTVLPTRASLQAEVTENAVAAATRDPRFRPLTYEELTRTRISIDLLSPLDPVASADELDPARFGLVLRAGGRTGVLLPGIPGVDSSAQQVAVCRRKA